LLGRASPLRTAHLRDLVGTQIQFASDGFIDEVAAAEAWCEALDRFADDVVHRRETPAAADARGGGLLV
jgi:hypothetical protein